MLLRPLSDEEASDLRALARSQRGEARLRDRARICWLSHEGRQVRDIVARTGATDTTVRAWITRFNVHGLDGLHDRGRSGRPPVYTAEEVSAVVAVSLTKPDDLDQPFGSWTLDRLATYLQEVKGIAMKRSRISELLRAEGLRWRTQETWFGERVDLAFAEKRGRLSSSTPRHRRTA